MKILPICSSVFLIFGIYTVGLADEHFPFLAQVKKESVNIRAGANTNFEKVDKLSLGAEVVVLAKTFDWYKVQLPITAKTYIRADYLNVLSHSMAQLIGDNVNIRVLPNSESSSLGVLKKGDLVKLIVQSNGWWQIDPPAQASGWIREDFLTIKAHNVDSSLIKGPAVMPTVSSKESSFAAVDVKGRLMPLAESQADMRYELLVNGKTAYYIQSVPSIDRFKGGMVLIKGMLVKDSRYQYPVLRTINISLLL